MNTDILALVKDIQDRVREVAYLMWESAGRQHGMALEYWLSAEREVITTMQVASDRMMPVPVRDVEEASPDAANANPPVSAPVTPPISQASDRVVAATAAAKAVPAPSEGASASADAEPVPASQASKAVVEATAKTAEDAAAAGSTAAAAKAAAKPTRKASPRAKRIPPPAS